VLLPYLAYIRENRDARFNRLKIEEKKDSGALAHPDPAIGSKDRSFYLAACALGAAARATA
jgi:hypothetical protein